MTKQIDLVYLWVDGSEPNWLKKKNSFLDDNVKKSTVAGRYQNNNELKYSLRSVSENLPWLRKIFIVTDNQVPEWLNTNNSKITIVDHSDIMPKEVLPTFNVGVMEYFIHKIPDLSEHFIYANDDCFVNANLSPDFFFKDGLPICRLISSRKFITKLRIKKLLNRYIGTYHLGILNALNLIKEKYGVYYKLRPHHNIDVYLKSDYEKAAKMFSKQIKGTLLNRFRKNNDIHRILFDCYALANKRAHLEYVTHKESGLIPLHSSNYQKRISNNPKLFCLNDNELATDEDRKKVVPFLENLFPNKSQFEK